MNNRFKLYIKIKKRLSLNYRGYNLGEIIAIEIVSYVYKVYQGSQAPYKHLLKTFKWVPNLSDLKEIIAIEGILFTISTEQAKREDYLELVNQVKTKILNSELKIIKIPVNSKKLNFSAWIKLCKVLVLVFLRTFPLLNLKAALYFSSRIFFYQKVIDELNSIEREHIKIKKYVAFNSSIACENLLTSFLNKNAISTYSLQHAIVDGYFLNKNLPPLDLINIENIVSNYLLCWSQATIDQIENYKNKVSKTKLLLAGSPKYNKLELAYIKQSFKSCLVFLGGVGGEQIDWTILEIIKVLFQQLGIKSVLKLHPQHLDDSDYLKKVKQYDLEIVPINSKLSFLLNQHKYDFTIAYNTTTTVYYESMCYGLLSFRYAPKIIDKNHGFDNDMFSSSEELFQKILYYQQLDQYTLLGQVKEILEYTVGINIDYYSKYLE